MPHSSGGGSSHGGSHSSSHHSSGGGSSHSSGSSSSSSSSFLKSSYKPGRHVFVHYGNNGPTYLYSDYSYRKTVAGGSVSPWRRIVRLCIAIPFLFYGFTYLFSVLQKEPVTSGETPCVIEDEADVFTEIEEDGIEQAASEYYDKTGIPIMIHTITEEEYLSADKDNLEIYAYYDYENLFNDEDHWLIVFLDKDRQSRTWEFEGMQGDDTDDWLTNSLVDDFNEELTENLWNTRLSYGDAFEEAIDSLTQSTSTLPNAPTPKDLMIIFGEFLIGILFVLAALEPSEERRALKNYHEVNIEDVMAGPTLTQCEYCGGTYVLGETACPHCGAPAKIRAR